MYFLLVASVNVAPLEISQYCCTDSLFTRLTLVLGLGSLPVAFKIR